MESAARLRAAHGGNFQSCPLDWLLLPRLALDPDGRDDGCSWLRYGEGSFEPCKAPEPETCAPMMLGLAGLGAPQAPLINWPLTKRGPRAPWRLTAGKKTDSSTRLTRPVKPRLVPGTPSSRRSPRHLADVVAALCCPSHHGARVGLANPPPVQLRLAQTPLDKCSALPWGCFGRPWPCSRTRHGQGCPAPQRVRSPGGSPLIQS